MKVYVIIAMWVISLMFFMYLYKALVKQILSLNKWLIETIDFVFLSIIQKAISNQDKIIDFQKTISILEEEKKQLYTPPYNLISLRRWWETAKQQQIFLSELLQEKPFVDETQIDQLLKILEKLCKVKKFVEVLLVILTMGVFLVVKKRIIKGVYVYC